MKRVAILQSNYIPWKGYFDLIASVDEFIIYDDMQYTRRDWRNRNKIKTSNGTQWLTVPVKVKGRYEQKINETEIDGEDWAKNHWRSLEQYYSRTPYFLEVASILESTYLIKRHSHLSVLNRDLLEKICNYLNIKTRILNSSDYILAEGKTERLVKLCADLKATQYISGVSAKSYIDEGKFSNAGIELGWFNYDGYLEYPQLWGKFVHEVSILDLLFNCGKSSYRYMRYISS